MNKEVQKSIITTYRKNIWKKFIDAVKNYNLIEESDKIAVCISGGKDSFLLAKCMQEIQKHGKIKFDLEFICMNPGYKDEDLSMTKENAEKLNIDLKIFNSNIFAVASKLNKEKPCYMCARMRRGYLYDYAKNLGCNKIALAHHMDDVIETILMNMFYTGKYASMPPKLNSTNFEGMKLIRPLYHVPEESIISWVKHNNLTFINCGCPIGSCNSSSKRSEIKSLIKELKKKIPDIDKNILNSSENVHLDTIIKYKKDDEYYSNI